MGSFLVQLPPGLDISQAQDLGNGSFKIGKHTYDLTPSHVPLHVCLLNKSGEQYVSGEAPTKLMELTRAVSLPKVDKSVVKPRPQIPQLQNLKARHFASGYNPKVVAAEAPAKRPAESAPETPKKKQKKEKKDKTPKSEKKKKEKKEKTSKTHN